MESLSKHAVLVYRKQNPVKFAWKFGDIDLDLTPDDFDFSAYKSRVTKERSDREVSGRPQSPVDAEGNPVDGYVPITPELFAPKEKKTK